MASSDDAVAATKAKERQARPVQMMTGRPEEQEPEGGQPPPQPPAPPSPSAATAGPSISSTLSDLARSVVNNNTGPQPNGGGGAPQGAAAGARPGSVTRVQFHPPPTTAASTMTTTAGPGLLSALERALLAKSGRSGGSGNSNDAAMAAEQRVLAKMGTAAKAAAVGQSQLSAQERDLLSKATTSAAGRTKGLLPNYNNNNIHVNALRTRPTRTTMSSGSTTSGPSAPRQEQLELQQYRTEDSTTYDASLEEGQFEEFSPADGIGAALTAEIVDDAVERDKITRAAQAALISNAVVATEVDDKEDEKRWRQSCRWTIVLVAFLLVVAAIVLGGVCGTGYCSKGPSANERAQALAKFIASITPTSTSSSSTTIVYPYTGAATSRAPEQVALDHFIENDPLQLSVVSNGDVTANWRLVQRYALLVIWFTNGPWTVPVDDDENDGVDVARAASSAWLVGLHECGWSGVDCDDGRVAQLHLSSYGLTGTVPGALGLLTDLEALRLNMNSLEGSLGDVIATLNAMDRLVTLDLSDCAFAGTIPDRLTDFVALQTLELGPNALTGTIPESISTMTALESLNLSYNEGLTGTIPASLAQLTSLTKLGLGNCDLSSATPLDFVTGMTDLAYLDLSRPNSNSGGDPYSLSQLSGLSKLSYLYLEEVPVLEGTLPSAIASWWPNMSLIALTGCNISGTIPPLLDQWTRLESIHLGSNQLTGSIPLSVYAAWSYTLTDFQAPANNIDGSLPTEIGLWTNVVSLNLRSNALTGSLPTTIGRLTNVETMYLSGNRLTGTIPTEILTLAPVSHVRLDDNNLTGVAPFCLDDVPGLTSHRVDCDEVMCPCCSGCQT